MISLPFSSPFLSTILIGMILLIVYFNIVFFIRLWKFRHFPGPFALPIVGNLHDPSAFTFMRYISNCQKKFGKYFLFWRGNSPTLVVTDPVGVRQILTDTKAFIKGEDYTSKFSIVFGKGLVTSIHEKHRKDRSLFAKYFGRSYVENNIPFINQYTEEEMKSTLEPVDGQSFNLENFFHMLTLRIFGRHAFSLDYSEDLSYSKWLNYAVSTGSSIIGKFIISGLPLFFWKFFPQFSTLKGFVSSVHSGFSVVVDKRVDQMGKGEVNEVDDCITTMLNADIPRQDMYEHLLTLMAAGHDTTAFFGCYMSSILAHNPEVQQKLKEEIKRVLGERTEVTAEDINKLDYMKKVIQETLRLYSVIPIITREAVDDIFIKHMNLTIPKGTQVLIPIFAMHRDSDIWENPSKFIPERFEGIDGITSAKHGYIPFGYGPRTCIGNQLAYVEAYVMFSKILQKFTFLPNTHFKPKISTGISLVSKNGIFVIVKKDSEI